MILSAEQRNFLLRRAAEAAPEEACGFILDNGIIVEVCNVAQNPCKAFRMDPYEAAQRVHLGGGHIVGVWHTHPSGSSRPSREDLEAMRIGAINRHWANFIVTATEINYINVNRYAPQVDSFWHSFVRT